MTTARLTLLLGFNWALASTGLAILHLSPAPPPPKVGTDTAEPLGLAAGIIRTTDRFASTVVGSAGVTSTQVLAWQVIYQHPQGDSVFKSLLLDGTRPGQFYALAGLFLRDRASYAVGAARQRSIGGQILTQSGCIAYERAVTAILSEMDSGRWSRDFLMGRPEPLFEVYDPRSR